MVILTNNNNRYKAISLSASEITNPYYIRWKIVENESIEFTIDTNSNVYSFSVNYAPENLPDNTLFSTQASSGNKSSVYVDYIKEIE